MLETNQRTRQTGSRRNIQTQKKTETDKETDITRMKRTTISDLVAE
jgi:hypothetical protein